MKSSYKTFLLWAVLILLFFSFYSIFSRSSGPPPRDGSFEELQADLQRGAIAGVRPDGEQLDVRLQNGTFYKVDADLDAELRSDLREHHVRIEKPASQSRSLWSGFLVSWT